MAADRRTVAAAFLVLLIICSPFLYSYLFLALFRQWQRGHENYTIARCQPSDISNILLTAFPKSRFLQRKPRFSLQSFKPKTQSSATNGLKTTKERRKAQCFFVYLVAERPKNRRCFLDFFLHFFGPAV
jgi:hypothetical protein